MRNSKPTIVMNKKTNPFHCSVYTYHFRPRLLKPFWQMTTNKQNKNILAMIVSLRVKKLKLIFNSNAHSRIQIRERIVFLQLKRFMLITTFRRRTSKISSQVFSHFRTFRLHETFKFITKPSTEIDSTASYRILVNSSILLFSITKTVFKLKQHAWNISFGINSCCKLFYGKIKLCRH